MTTAEKIALYKIILLIKKNDFYCAEIGSYLGASANFICSALYENSKLICIDTWENDAMKYVDTDTDAEKRDTYKEFKENTRKFSNKIIELRGWSSDMIDNVRSITAVLDFLFIDGDHNYESVKKDWDYYSPLLMKDSYVAFHDTGWAEGVNKLIEEEVKTVSVLVEKLPNLKIYRIN